MQLNTGELTLAGILEKHGAFIRRTLAHLGVRGCDLEDVAQEVHQGVARGLRAFDPSLSRNPETAVRGWLFGICERQAASHRRDVFKRGDVLCPNQELDLESTAVTVEDMFSAEERIALLRHLLSRLDPARRAIVVAYEIDGARMDDVAVDLGIPVNTAWNRLRLGRADLRTAWKRLATKGRGARSSRCRVM